jgi:hypothetical protein
MTKVGVVGTRAAPRYYRLDTSICNGNTDTVRGVMATEWVSFKLEPAGFEPQARSGVT